MQYKQTTIIKVMTQELQLCGFEGLWTKSKLDGSERDVREVENIRSTGYVWTRWGLPLGGGTYAGMAALGAVVLIGRVGCERCPLTESKVRF